MEHLEKEARSSTKEFSSPMVLDVDFCQFTSYYFLFLDVRVRNGVTCPPCVPQCSGSPWYQLFISPLYQGGASQGSDSPPPELPL